MKHVVDTVALRKLMADHNIHTIAQLSDKSGVNRNTLGKVLNGTERPSVIVMDKLSCALEMSPETSGSVFFAQNLRGA